MHGAPKIVIATGSVPRPLTMEGAELVTGSDAALALDAVPRSASDGAASVTVRLARRP